MQRKLVFLLGILAVLATSVIAQNSSQNTSGPNATVRLTELETGLARYLESDDEIVTDPLGRPRIVNVKASSVRSAVIVNMEAAERTAFDLINQKRLENGLSELTWNNDVAAIARLHSQNMAEFKFFGHRGHDNKVVSDRADEYGLGRWRSIGENIAFNRGYQDPVVRAVELWLNSPSHRNNLLSSNWRESAVGVAVTEDGSYYFTQVFLQKK